MRKRTRTGPAAAATASVAAMNVWKREVGALSTRSFSNRLAASEDLMLRLDVFRKLEKHNGCVNTVSFNAGGDVLVTGSDDRKVIIWDWESGKVKLSFHSEHHNNIFQAKFMPYSEDCSIVTCAADGQVRHAQILEGGKVESKFLTKHQGQVHELAIEPGCPHVFFTCGEDGMVQHLDLRRTRVATKLLTCQPMTNRRFNLVNPLNSITIDPRNPNLFAVAGGDSFARLYDIRKYNWNGSDEIDQPVDFFCPAHLRGSNYVGITGLAFSDQSELLVSYANEYIYLFSKDMGLGPDPESPLTFSSDSSEMGEEQHPLSSIKEIEADAAEGPKVFKGHVNRATIKGVSFLGPKCEYVTTGSDCGRIFIWKKGGELIRVMEADRHVVNSIEAHPYITVLASCGIENNIKIWTPRATERAILPTKIEKVRVHGTLQFVSYDGFIDYSGLSDYEFSDFETDEDEYDIDDGDDDDDDSPGLSMDDGSSDSMDEEEEEEEEEEEDGDEEFFDSIVGGVSNNDSNQDDAADRSLDDDEDRSSDH